MAQAKQCNRCARLYKHYKRQINIPEVRASYNGVIFVDISKDGNGYQRGNCLDLCPECMDSLVRWFEGVETKNTSE